MTKTQTLKKLISYCELQGVEMVGEHDGYTEFRFLTNKRKNSFKYQVIKYNKFLPKTFLIYGILHELGHRQLILDGFDKTHGKLYHKNFVKFLEEILAWKTGADIAKKAKIPVNFAGYSKYSSAALRTYVAGLFMSNDAEIARIQRSLEKLI